MKKTQEAQEVQEKMKTINKEMKLKREQVAGP
jgi:hypothetical protein